MLIREETTNDVEAIRELVTSAFPSPAEARLVDLLRQDDQLTLSLVAEVDGRVVGHVAFSPVTASNITGGQGLAPVSASSVFRKRGIAAALIRHGLDELREQDVPFVVVLGDPAYYARFEFEAAANRDLHDEYGGGDAFQVLELREGALAGSTGLVRYADAFARL